MDGRIQRRILVLAQGRDATLTQQLLSEGNLDAELCNSIESLLHNMNEGAAAIVLGQEFLTVGSVSRIVKVLNQQPQWSDLPLIIVAGGGEEQIGRLRNALAVLGNVSVLQRPIAVDTFLTTVSSALRARRRQYEVRDLLAERAEDARRKDEFLAMLAHELRNPLAPIRSAVELMGLWNLQDPEQQEVIEIMRRQVMHMAHMLDDLLDVSRITRGAIKLDLRVVDLGEAMESAARTAASLIKEKSHEFHVRLPEEPIQLRADPTRLHQVIWNIVSNAAKYTNPGGKIELSGQRVDGWAEIVVCDNGLGIGPDVLPKIFDLFAQGDRALDRGTGGLGIGLTVVKNIVELHGGSVTAHSDGPDCGTRVVVRLPAIQVSRPNPQGESQANPSAPLGQRVLVVDDNLDGAQTLARLLKVWGHDVLVAGDSFTALEASPSFMPQVCLLDIGLPVMNGYDLAQALRLQPWFNGARLIAISGYGQESDRQKSREAGFHAHLVKPVDPVQLREQLSLAMQANRLSSKGSA